MTDEQINWLLEGVPAWNDRRENYRFAPRLDGVNIWDAFRRVGKLDMNGQIPLKGVDFGWGNFQEKPDLSGANLFRADLSCANLSGAKLRKTYLNSADLSNADLSSADMTDAKLEHAILAMTDLRRSILTGANFNGAKPWKARLFTEEEIKKTPHQIEMDNLKVCSIEDLLHQIRNLKDHHPELRFFFRGEPQCDWSLRPSVMRDKFIEFESEMLLELMSRRPEEFNGVDSALDQWIIAQHHGLKTRFLDITRNPMVALFFACDDKNHEQKDGRLHIFAVPQSLVKGFTSDTISIIANFAMRPRNEQRTLLGYGIWTDFFDSEVRYPEAMDKLCQFVQSEKPYFANRIDIRDFYRVFVAEPRQAHERIRAQSGAFLISAFHERLERSEILKKNNDIPVYAHYELILPYECKTAIKEDLRLLNVMQETLFPGLDTSAQAITELYSKRVDNQEF